MPADVTLPGIQKSELRTHKWYAVIAFFVSRTGRAVLALLYVCPK